MNNPPRPPFTPTLGSPSSVNSRSGGGGTNGKPESKSRRLWLTGQAGSDAGGPDAEQFDALTDLFLGEVSRSRKQPIEQPENVASRAPTDAPRLRLTGSDDPEPDTFDRAQPERADIVRSTDEPAPRPRSAAPFVECLIVGNLPVLASAWASQYVREIAEIGGRPVAAVRLQSGYVTVDLIGGAADNPAMHAQTGAKDPESALRAAASVTDRWVVRVDTTDETMIAGRGVFRLVTLLTGADESSRVNAYASLKDLAEKLPGSPPPTADAASGPVIRVAIMSASKDEAGAAASRIVETARKQLGREIQHAVCSAKIKAGNAPTIVFNGKTDLNAAALLDLMERVLGVNTGRSVDFWKSLTGPADGIVEPAHAVREIVETPRVESVVADLLTELESTLLVSPPESAPIADKPHPAESVAESAVEPTLAAPVDDVRLWASAAATSRQPSAPSSPIGALSSHLAATRPLSLHCPYATDVEFALDADGGLHLLARGTNDDDEAALGRLMAATAWIESHRALIEAALALKLTGSKAVLHLFTAKPRKTRRLLDTDVKIHLLAPVEVGGASGWYCTELN